MAEEKAKEKEHQRRIIIAMAVLSSALIFVGIALGDAAVLGNLIIISIFLTAVPYFFFRYSKYMWVKSLELEFPNFVRDLADSVRSMPLPEALGVVKRSNYGNLTPEINKMHNRMSWGTPFLRALEIFHEKVRSSKIISEALMILKESYMSGGNMVFTLESIARDLLMLREAEQERSSMLRQHIMIMYAIFFMFLGISLLIIFVMVPMLQTQATPVGGGFAGQLAFSNPCPPERAMLFPCGLYVGISTTLGLDPEEIGAYYIALFFYALLIQGIFVGLITGQLGENSVTSGIKHSLIMVSVTLVVFLFFSKLGLLPA
jgi:flagellar protein FlaJ